MGRHGENSGEIICRRVHSGEGVSCASSRPIGRRASLLHSPFARSSAYCSFYVEVGSKNKTRFSRCALREVDRAGRCLRAETEHDLFGGGTPSALTTSAARLSQRRLRKRLDLSALTEWTLEANRHDSRRKSTLLRPRGDPLRPACSRGMSAAGHFGPDSSGDAGRRNLLLLLRDWVHESKYDLMFSVPGQNRGAMGKTLAKTIALNPEHVC